MTLDTGLDCGLGGGGLAGLPVGWMESLLIGQRFMVFVQRLFAHGEYEANKRRT